MQANNESEDKEKQMNLEYLLEMKSIGLANGLNIRRKKEMH